MYRICISIPIATSLVLSISSLSAGQDSKLFTPHSEHKLLQRFAGKWQFEKWPAPTDDSKPKKVGSGKIKSDLLGGFFVVWKWSGDVYESKFSAVQTLGHDVSKKKYGFLD